MRRVAVYALPYGMYEGRGVPRPLRSSSLGLGFGIYMYYDIYKFDIQINTANGGSTHVHSSNTLSRCAVL